MPTVTCSGNQTVNIGGSVTFTATAGGTGPLSYQWLFDCVKIANATNSTYSVTGATACNAGIYTCNVTNLCGTASCSSNLTVTNIPVIITPPGNITECAGGSAQLCVTATGIGLTYQWYYNGKAISNATQSCYTIGATSGSNTGSYYVVVSTCNPSGTNGCTTYKQSDWGKSGNNNAYNCLNTYFNNVFPGGCTLGSNYTCQLTSPAAVYNYLADAGTNNSCYNQNYVNPTTNISAFSGGMYVH